MAPPHELMPKWGVMVKPKGKEKEAGLRKFLNSRRRSASAIAKDEIGPLNRSSKWIGTFRSNSPAEQKKILEGHAGRVMGRALREDRKGILTTALGRRNAMGHELARVPEIPRAVARFGKEKTSSLDILRKNASPKNPTAQERFYTSTKESSGDILGMNAKRRAKAESASAHPSFGKFAEAAFFDELIKIANMDTALGSLVLGAKAGGVIGGVRKAADPSQEPGKVGRVVKGIATGAVVGALLALGMQRNAAGKNTFGKW